MAEDTNKNYIGNYTSTSGAHNGYSTNQFLRSNEYETSPLSRTTKDNPEFLYPRNPVPNIYDSPNNVVTPTTVQRGFIRGIFPEVIKDIQKKNPNKYTGANPPIRRCFFQFNPSLILRSVQASSSTLNPLLQSATELIQPIPGQASFEFQLLFNREREVSNQQYKNANGRVVGTSDFSKSLASYGSPDAPYSQADVGDIGVFADLYVLDSIIGQSITQDMVDTVKAYWDATKEGRGTSTTTTDAKGKTTTTSDNPWSGFDFNKDDFNKRLQSVLGNTAFLNPMPVRIVFSSLFMVEGFVTASNVAFHKFSTNMIPTVCTVTLNVQALYIGFAKKQSYVSEQISQQIQDVIDQQVETEELAKKARETVYKYAHAQLNYINGITNTLDVGSLNTWFSTNWNANADAIRYYLRGATSNGSATIEGLYVWTDVELHNQLDSAVQELTIESAQLLLLDKSKLPNGLKTTDQIKKAAESGGLNESSAAGFRYFEENGTAYAPNYTMANLQIYTLTDTSMNTPFDKVHKGTKENPARFGWYTSDINTHGVGTSRPVNSFFGTNNYMVFVVTFQYYWQDSNGDVQGPVSVRKAQVMSFDASNSDAFKNLHKKGPFGSLRSIAV